MIEAKAEPGAGVIKVTVDGENSELEQELVAILTDALDRLTEEDLLEITGTAIQAHKELTGETTVELLDIS